MSRLITQTMPARIVRMETADEEGNPYPDGQILLAFLVPADVIVAAGEYTITRADGAR